MKDKKKHNLLTKHVIQQVLPIFDELFKTLDERFEQLDKDELKKKYFKDTIGFVDNFEQTANKKRKINPYAAFLSNKQVQAEIKNNNPDLTFGELSKLKGQIWKNLSQEKKDYYKIFAKKQKQKYNT